MDSSTVADSPVVRSRDAISPTAIGARLGITTRNSCCAASPPTSVAVIVITPVPGATPFTVTRLPDNDAVTTPGSELATP